MFVRRNNPGVLPCTIQIMFKLNNYYRLTFLLLGIIFFTQASPAVFAQEGEKKLKLNSESKKSRDYALKMLDEMKEILEEHYYDQKFRGVDLKARIEAAKTRVKTLEFNWQMYRVLVQVLMEFNDSHTTMILPPRTDYFQYGLGWQMIGNNCYVTYVKKDSDAAVQGVEVGDQLLSIGRFKPTRNDLWKIGYMIYKLDPAKTLNLKLLKPDGTEKSLVINAKTQTDKEFRAELKAKKEKAKGKDKENDEPFKCQEIDKTLAACKLYSFIVEKSDIDKMMKVAAKYPKLILDLRGNGGGYVTVEEYFLSYFFDQPVKIASVISKGKTEVRMTKPLGVNKQYKGEVTVLIDSRSASASEMTARVLQLQKRGKVFGDFSSGSVMTSITVPFRSLMSAFADYAMIRVGMSVTVADVIMSDGSRLEHIGVEPDEVLQPNGSALKEKLDSVLAYAVGKNGVEISPEKAGKYYFITEKDEENEEDAETSGN